MILGEVLALQKNRITISVGQKHGVILNATAEFFHRGRRAMVGKVCGFDQDGHANVQLDLTPRQQRAANFDAVMLCPKCRNLLFFTADAGRCMWCKTGVTLTGSHKLCPECARQQGRCMNCGVRMRPPAAPLPVALEDRVRIRKVDNGAAWGEAKWGLQVGLCSIGGGAAVPTFPADARLCLGVKIARATQNPLRRKWEFAFTSKDTGVSYLPLFQPTVTDDRRRDVGNIDKTHPPGKTKTYRVCFEPNDRGYRDSIKSSRATRSLPPGRYDVVMTYNRDLKSSPLEIEVVPGAEQTRLQQARLQKALEASGLTQAELLAVAKQAALEKWRSQYGGGIPVCVAHGEPTVEPEPDGWKIRFASPKSIRWSEEIVVVLDRSGKTVRSVAATRNVPKPR
jgi:hypothetical protein